jgi:PKD repeat protein
LFARKAGIQPAENNKVRMKRQAAFFVTLLFLLAGSGCYKKVAIPVADFSYRGSNDTVVPDTVTFRNLSQNASTYEWTFGDSYSSSATDPVHIYTAAGSYTVVLKAYDSRGDQWATKTRIIAITGK